MCLAAVCIRSLVTWLDLCKGCVERCDLWICCGCNSGAACLVGPTLMDFGCAARTGALPAAGAGACMHLWVYQARHARSQNVCMTLYGRASHVCRRVNVSHAEINHQLPPPPPTCPRCWVKFVTMSGCVQNATDLFLNMKSGELHGPMRQRQSAHSFLF